MSATKSIVCHLCDKSSFSQLLIQCYVDAHYVVNMLDILPNAKDNISTGTTFSVKA